MTPALLLLMHQGNSFVEELAAVLRPKGIALVALTSQPAQQAVFDANTAYLADWIVTAGERIVPGDVRDVVARFGARGFAIGAALATFEGYRLLMAELNGALGARDSSPASLRLALRKDEFREFLLRHGLSAARCRRVEPGRLPELDPDTAWFVKPVRGAGSFGCFVLRDAADFDDLPMLQEQMRHDGKMSAIFMDQYAFVAEEYIDGPEFSFETIAVGAAYHVAVHEKTKMESRGRTTLEGMSVSPPVSIDAAAVAEGAAFVSRCLDALGLRAGAFHIEAKYWTAKRRWELVEVNPRMGGSLINASVEAVTGCSMLELWVESLLARGDAVAALRERLLRDSQLPALRAGTVTKASVFLSRYGEKGRTIASIEPALDARPPDVLKLHARAGTRLEDSDRELCLMDALWRVDYADLAHEVDALDGLVTEHFRVAYAALVPEPV